MFVEQNITLPINMFYMCYLRCKEWAGNAYDACAKTVGACGTFSQRAESLDYYSHSYTYSLQIYRP